jgi:hypothetical protein
LKPSETPVGFVLQVALSSDPALRSTLSNMVGAGGDDGYLAVAQLAFGLLLAEDGAGGDAAVTAQVNKTSPYTSALAPSHRKDANCTTPSL